MIFREALGQGRLSLSARHRLDAGADNLRDLGSVIESDAEDADYKFGNPVCS